MKQFTDDAGRTWTLKATVAALERIKDATDVDFLTLLTDQQSIEKFTSSNEIIVNALYAWLQPQIESQKVKPEDFGENVYESLEAAFTAVLEELPNFFPPHRRETIRKILDRYLQAEQQSMQRVEEILASDRTQTNIQKLLDQATEDAYQVVEKLTGGNESTSSPASSRSTPDH